MNLLGLVGFLINNNFKFKNKKLSLEVNKLEEKVRGELNSKKEELKIERRSDEYREYCDKFSKVEKRANLWKYGGMLTIPLSFIFGALTYGLLGRKKRKEIEDLDKKYILNDSNFKKNNRAQK
jgi:hypothetical protein